MKRSRPAGKNVEEVYDALRSVKRPMSAYQVLDQVRGHGISAPPTVYRALEQLVDQGRVHRLESMNAYVACCDPGHQHNVPVFAICVECKSTQELSGAVVRAVLDDQAERAGFAMEHATVELKGRCAACRSASEANTPR